jgi:capsular exopolysaccharide synthesis family protein
MVREQPELAADPHLPFYAATVTRNQARSAVSEAYRTLRTNLEFAAIGRHLGPGSSDAQILLVTSSSAGEGKTTTAVNLAVVMAQMGKRVLLFDCDLRNPRIHRFFGVERAPGFTDVILGSVGLDEAIRSSGDVSVGRGNLLRGLAADGLDRLHLLSSGTAPPHPAEILGSPRFDEVLGQLRERFDMVLLDSPPVLPVTDAAILGSKVDGVVLVHQLGRISRNALRRAKVLLDNVRSSIWGIVLNDLRANVTGYNIESDYARERDTAEGNGRQRPSVVLTAGSWARDRVSSFWSGVRGRRRPDNGRSGEGVDGGSPPGG